MRTIAVIARKGGSGKTTVATHLALAAHLRGLRTLLADTDPQRSSSEVIRAREADGPHLAESAGPKLFALQMAAQRDGFDAMIIDTAGGATEDVADSVVLADLSLLIVRPTYLDLAAAAQTVDLVRRLRRPMLIVMNQAPHPRGGAEAPAVRRALQAIAVLRTPVAPTVLRSRAIYQTALETGRSAEESGDAAAQAEVASLWAFVERLTYGRARAVADGA